MTTHLDALRHMLLAVSSFNHSLAHLPLVLLHARVITIAVVSQCFSIGVRVRHVSDLRAIDCISSLLAICFQFVMIDRITLRQIAILLSSAIYRVFME